MTKLDQIIERPKNYRRQALVMTSIALVVVAILWNIPQLSFLVYPLRLFVTYVHEACHSLAALLTGGQVLGFLVSPDGSGLAVTAGGSRWLIIPAGYLGAALFGSLLFFFSNRLPRYSHGISVGLGIGMIAFTVLFARPDDRSGLPLALILGVGFGALLMLAGVKLGRRANLLLLNVLAVMTALNGVLDLLYLTRSINATRGSVGNDAVAFSQQVMPLVPPVLVAFVWAILAVLMLAVAVWYGLIKPFRDEVNDSYEQFRQR